MREFVFNCHCCGKAQTGFPALTFHLPAHAYAVPEPERGERVRVSADLCCVDDKHYFIRGVLRIPIVGEDQGVEFGCWGSVSEKSFQNYVETFDSDDQARLGPFFSWFNNELPLYEGSTIGLRANLVPQNGRDRPLFAIDPTESHQIVDDIAAGISRDQAIAFAMLALPKH